MVQNKRHEMPQVALSFIVKGKPRQIIKLLQKIDFYCGQLPVVLLKKHHSQKGAKRMMFLKRLFPDKEVKAALGIVDECDLIFSRMFSNRLFGDAFQIIKQELVPYLYKTSHILKENIKKGRSVRVCVYNLIATIAQNHITSGDYHMYRGVLSSLKEGYELSKICDEAIDFLVKEGDLTQEGGEQWKADIREQISEAG